MEKQKENAYNKKAIYETRLKKSLLLGKTHFEEEA